ncbi:MAG TPA: insecticidal delta-endotoxin Cry8Ea1 family protein [Rhodopila sp.]|nr:insecticidal delta-endotoxin Cry8Ea1 family protein [Rhodopila sp.]
MDIEIDPKRAVVFGLSKIPEFGEVLSFLVEILWPDKGGEDPWDLIKDRTEQLINQKIDDYAYGRVQASLNGIKDHFDEFKATLQATTDPEHRFASFESLKGSFLDHAPEFQQNQYQTLLLPLFSQFANMHLSFLRTGYQHGQDQMNLEPAEVTLLRNDLKSTTKNYSDYVTVTLDAAMNVKFAELDPRIDFVRSMTLNVVDYATLWKYMDPDAAPPSGMPLPREIFSPAAGVDNPYFHQPSDQGYYPPPPSADKISRIMVWGAAAIDAIQVWYGDKATPKMGGNGGFLNQDLNLADNGHGELTLIETWSWDLVSGLRLHCKDGSIADAGAVGQERQLNLSPPEGHYISSISVISRFHDATRGWLYNDLVRTLYCGFKFNPDALTPQTFRGVHLPTK